MTDPHRELFLETATVIDGIDQEIEEANERKKETYADVKDELEPVDFKALKEAIKLRRKRRADKDACERHDERVWAILNVLEATEQPRTHETPPRATAVAANGHSEETTPTRAHPHVAHEPELPRHSPETGELIEYPLGVIRQRSKARLSETMADHKKLSQHAAELGLISNEAAQENASLADAVSDKLGNGVIPDIPACLDRRHHAEAAE